MRSRPLRVCAAGAVATGLAFWPLALAAGAGVPPPDTAIIPETLSEYSLELYAVDIDGDGIADITDSDGDGVPEIPVGEPGDRDLTPENPLFGAAITAELENLGLDTVVSISDSSKLIGECSGMALSFDDNGVLKDGALGIPSNEGGGPNGQLIDIAGSSVGQRAFTKSNPFEVHETVIYFGRLPRSGDGPMDHTWFIKTAGISLDSGGDDNPGGNNRSAGSVDLTEIPSALRPSGIFPGEGELTSANGPSCRMEGWVEFKGGNPLLSVPSAIAAVFGGAGILGLLFNSRPAITWREG